MTAAQRHPVAVVAALFASLVGLILLIAVNLPAAVIVALLIGSALGAMVIRAGGPWFAEIPETHPDACGSLDIEHLKPPTP